MTETFDEYADSMKGKIIFKIDMEVSKGWLDIDDLKEIRENIDGFIDEIENPYEDNE